MSKTLFGAIAALSSLASNADAAGSVVPVPAAVVALTGCWRGTGNVMRKAVTVRLAARPIVQNMILIVDVDSSGKDDKTDRYAAHLIFGGTARRPDTTSDPIVGFWADSFGGAFTATGNGSSRPDGFDISYRYPDDTYVNRWRLAGDRLTWRIVERNAKGIESPFANYSLIKSVCNPTEAH